MTRGEYLRQLNDHELAEAIAGVILFSIYRLVSGLGINADEFMTDDVKDELVDGIEKELGDEYV